MRPHRILLACTAAGALAVVPAASAFAGPAGHGHGTLHGHGTHGSGTHGHGHGTHDKLTGPRHAAGRVLAAQSARLNRSLQNVSGDGTMLNPADQAALITALQADMAALSVDVAAIPNAASVAELNAIKHAAVGTVTLAVGQVRTTVDGDALEAQASDDATTLADLAAQVATAEQNGQDMTAAQAALDDAQTQLTTATGDAQAAVSTILAVSPTASRDGFQTALAAADQELAGADTALLAVDADIATVNAALGN